jgi:hypothetical protein
LATSSSGVVIRLTLAAAGLARYIPSMRRPTRLGLAILAALVVIAGAYTVYWFVVAGQIKNSVDVWAQSERADKIDVSWQGVTVRGFPVAFRVELDRAALRDNAVSPSPELNIPIVSGTARPWDFADWRLRAQAGFSVELAGAGERAPVKLTTRTADGVVSVAPEGGWKLWLGVQDVAVDAANRVRISSAGGWVIVPPKPPLQHTDPALGLALNFRHVHLPIAVEPLGDTIEQLDFNVTVKGGLPSGKLAKVAAAWRDAGGTIELDNLLLSWGGLGAAATGTVALDQDLQLIGGFSGAIQGYDKVLTALVQNGHMRATDAGLARIALTMLAKAGPDGKPEIKTAFTIQNGQMFLGPAKLGKAPRITWE